MKIGRHYAKSHLGFTLMELMVVMAILAIMAVIAIPAFSRWIPDHRLKAAATDLFSNFQRAKMEAVKRNADVAISFSPQAYNPIGGVGSYEMFVDDGSGGGTAGNFVRDGSEPVILQANMPSNVSLYSANFTGGTTAVGFDSRGLPISGRTGDVQLRNNQSRYYQVSVSTAGNISMQTSDDGAAWN